MRRLFALLVLLFAAVHPVVHQHPSSLPELVAIHDSSVTQDCPCTHAVAVNDAPPQLTALPLPAADQAALPATPFAAGAHAGDLPARAPPAVA